MKLSRTRQVDFSQGSLMKAALRFTVPALLANIFSSLYSIVDATVCGRLVGAEALAAVNASFALNMVLVAVCVGLGIGTSVVLSQLYGSGRMDEVARAIGTALSTAMTVCLTIMVLALIFSRPLLVLLNTPAEILESSLLYFRIVMVGFAGQLLSGMGNGLLRGLGDSSYPAFCLLVTSVLNIVLDLLFVAVFHWGVAGVAWATVIAHYVSAALPISRLLSSRYGYHVNLACFRIRMKYLKMIIQVGLFSALNQMVTAVGMVLIQTCANHFGTDLVAANGVVQKVDSFALLPMSTIGGTISIFCGQLCGGGLLDRARDGSRRCTLLCMAVALVMGALVFLLAPQLLLLFIRRSDPRYAAVSAIGVQALRVLAFFYIAYGLEQCLYCRLQGMGALRPAMAMTAVGMAIRVAFTWFLAVGLERYILLFWATGCFYVALCLLYGAYLRFGNPLKYVVVKQEEQA